MHNQRVFRLSEVQTYLGNVSKFPDDCHLVGDSAYKLYENLLVPYKDNGHLTERQKNYNFCHASARIAIERSFAFLKRRFRSLLTKLAMDRINLIPKHIIACCILHNVCFMKGDEIEIELENMDEEIEQNDVEHNVGNEHNVANAATLKRDLIYNRLRMRCI